MALDDKKVITNSIDFTLNGKTVSAFEDETIWQVAQRLSETDTLGHQSNE